MADRGAYEARAEDAESRLARIEALLESNPNAGSILIFVGRM